MCVSVESRGWGRGEEDGGEELRTWRVSLRTRSRWLEVGELVEGHWVRAVEGAFLFVCLCGGVGVGVGVGVVRVVEWNECVAMRALCPRHH